MNTPSHAILNLALLLPEPQALPIITLGAILPDVPMFVLYAWAKIRRIPARQLWTETYYLPFWQTWTDLFHSIPLASVGVGVGILCQSHTLALLSGSAVLHSLLDLPVHHDDAHRHFFPFHHYRFISPVSYWDPRHHGYIVALVEILLVLIATLYLFPIVESVFVQGLFIAVNVLYIGVYLLMFVRRRLPNLFCQAALNRD
ncbi:hypothetical protein [Acaryochloris thomasi]|uniref:hypothetical protein n=1 Tax=Acaryochloris thomasi TaxID=2929456 RepID=UPI000DA66BDC|nr:hypothetical protein [Acaryochloris thomasi]